MEKNRPIFTNEYFLDEVRNGFYVPGEIKRAWAAELEVLFEIDKICTQHNIQYFADWGTLLAAVRHQGFIPWDDDLDIVMKRADYEKFMAIAPLELPEGFSAYNYKNHDDFWLFLARVVGKQRICFEEDHLERFHQFPYIAGVDIFVLDYVSRDEEAEQKRNQLAKKVIATADGIAEGVLSENAKNMILLEIERETKIIISPKLTGNDLRRALYEVVEKLFSKFAEEESDELTQLFPFGMRNRKFRFPKECYDDYVYIPYENTHLRAPKYYMEMLRRRYGNFLTLIRNVGGHEYPFFKIQHEQLLGVLDFDLPTYKFSDGQLRNTSLISTNQNNCYKSLIIESEKILQENVSDKRMAEAQQLAIDLGLYIETICGEGTNSVKLLEHLCEELYVYVTTEENEKQFAQLLHRLNEIETCIDAEIISVKEYVFMVSRTRECSYIIDEIREKLLQEKTHVVLAIAPYFFKQYDGRLFDKTYEIDSVIEYISAAVGELVEKIEVVNAELYDFELHYPESIFIFNPCDEWNSIISLPNCLFSVRLQKCTSKLIYIQAFDILDFNKDCYREYSNMNYYVTVPGVVRADEIRVQSNQMVDTYVEKLTEWAGEQTREIWEQKIFVRKSKLDVCPKRKYPKRKVVFFVQIGSVLYHTNKSIEKIERAVGAFVEQKDSIEVVWVIDSNQMDELKRLNENMYLKLTNTQNEFWEKGIGVIESCEAKTINQIVGENDAYYGDESSLALEFMMTNKPVMIMRVDV